MTDDSKIPNETISFKATGSDEREPRTYYNIDVYWKYFPAPINSGLSIPNASPNHKDSVLELVLELIGERMTETDPSLQRKYMSDWMKDLAKFVTKYALWDFSYPLIVRSDSGLIVIEIEKEDNNE